MEPSPSFLVCCHFLNSTPLPPPETERERRGVPISSRKSKRDPSMDGTDDERGETPTLAASMETLTLTLTPDSSDDPLSPATHFASPSDLCFELDSLHDLAARGQWRAVLDKAARARSLPALPPHHHLVYLAFSLLALFKLRRFRDAESELHSALSDELDSPRFRYDYHPAAYPSRSGSMLPFAVRYLHAELPLRLSGDRAATLDRLYALLDLVRCRIHEKEDGGGARSDLWRRREAFLVASLCRQHFANREFDVCLLLIRELLTKDPSDPSLLSRLAYVQMQIGDLDGSRATFARVEELCAQRGGVEWENLAGRNRALGFVVAKDYAAAVREYEACIERDPADVVAINNKALCLMYSRDLSDSIKVLEGALERVPTAAVNETLVVNLCSMYELAYVNHGDVKKSLNTWIARVAPDDFDSSCTRI